MPPKESDSYHRVKKMTHYSRPGAAWWQVEFESSNALPGIQSRPRTSRGYTYDVWRFTTPNFLESAKMPAAAAQRGAAVAYAGYQYVAFDIIAMRKDQPGVPVLSERALAGLAEYKDSNDGAAEYIADMKSRTYNINMYRDPSKYRGVVATPLVDGSCNWKAVGWCRTSRKQFSLGSWGTAAAAALAFDKHVVKEEGPESIKLNFQWTIGAAGKAVCQTGPWTATDALTRAFPATP